MKKIYKYELELGVARVEMPIESNVLSVGNQRGAVCLWAEVDTISPYTGKEPLMETRTFHTIGTGYTVPQGLKYIDTIIVEPFVWHIYEEASISGKK